MIDDPGTVTRLMDQLRAHLPMPALPTKAIVRTLRQQGVPVSVKQVRIPAGHPLFGAIQAYQRERVRRLTAASLFG